VVVQVEPGATQPDELPLPLEELPDELDELLDEPLDELLDEPELDPLPASVETGVGSDPTHPAAVASPVISPPATRSSSVELEICDRSPCGVMFSAVRLFMESAPILWIESDSQGARQAPSTLRRRVALRAIAQARHVLDANAGVVGGATTPRRDEASSSRRRPFVACDARVGRAGSRAPARSRHAVVGGRTTTISWCRPGASRARSPRFQERGRWVQAKPKSRPWRVATSWNS
jgi:hypothetical protein